MIAIYFEAQNGKRKVMSRKTKMLVTFASEDASRDLIGATGAVKVDAEDDRGWQRRGLVTGSLLLVLVTSWCSCRFLLLCFQCGCWCFFLRLIVHLDLLHLHIQNLCNEGIHWLQTYKFDRSI